MEKIRDDLMFDLWCKMIADDIWNIGMPTKEQVYKTLRASTLSNIDRFIECIQDKVDADFFKAKSRVENLIINKSMKSGEYHIASAELSRAKRRRSAFIVAEKQQRELANKHKKDSQDLLIEILIENGLQDIIDKWKEELALKFQQ